MKLKISSLHIVVGLFTVAAIFAAVMYGAARQMAVAGAVAVVVGSVNRVVCAKCGAEDDPVAICWVFGSLLVLLACTVAICYWYVANAPEYEESLTAGVGGVSVAIGSVGVMALGCWVGYRLTNFLWR